MVADPEVLVRLTRLASELDHDWAALRARAAEIASLSERWQREGSLPRPEMVLVAVNLHGWYTALETGLERIARSLDQTVPTGNAWHTELVAQMQLDVKGLRPAVLPMAAELHELRKFRHFFRNAYVLELDPGKLQQRAADLLRIEATMSASLDKFLAFVRDAIEAVVKAD